MLVIDYLIWHYTKAPGGILAISKNYLIAGWHKFLIGRHFKTLFSPWHRSNPSDIGVVKTIGDRIMNLVVDGFIRLVAGFIRLLVICLGLIWEVIQILIFIFLIIVWLFWPIIFIVLIIKGIAVLT